MQKAWRPLILQLLKATFNIARLLLPIAVASAVVGLLVLALRVGTRDNSPVRQNGSGDPQHLVAILQYLESDYPAAVASGDSVPPVMRGPPRRLKLVARVTSRVHSAVSACDVFCSNALNR